MMTKWEYRIEKMPDHSDWKSTKENWDTLLEIHYRTMNGLGELGWEFMMHIGPLFYFKREIEPEMPVYKDGVKLEFSKKYSYESCLDGYVIYDVNNRILSGSEVEALLNKEGI